MNKPHKHAELIKAWADGATIEALNEPTNAWYLAEPLWHLDVQYRIKPEPKWYDNIPEQGVLCFVAQKQHELEQSQLVRIIFEFFDGRFKQRNGFVWKYARPVTLEEIQHLIYKGGQ